MGSLIERKKRILMVQPHIETVQSGNTSDSSVIAHFQSDMAISAVDAVVQLPYKSGGYSGVKVTACGVNVLECDTFTNGSRNSVSYTGYKNSDNQIEYITAVGTSSGTNGFRNVNYSASKLKWPPTGAYATYTYSDDATVMFNGDLNTPFDRDGKTTGDRVGKWKVYDLNNSVSNNSTWSRIQLQPYECNGKTFNIKIYPLICLAQDHGCEYEPYNGKTYNIQFSSTVYGCKVHLLTGEITDLYSSTGDIAPGTVSNAFTPLNIKIKKGVNNIWSDNGTITIKYWKH